MKLKTLIAVAALAFTSFVAAETTLTCEIIESRDFDKRNKTIEVYPMQRYETTLTFKGKSVSYENQSDNFVVRATKGHSDAPSMDTYVRKDNGLVTAIIRYNENDDYWTVLEFNTDGSGTFSKLMDCE